MPRFLSGCRSWSPLGFQASGFLGPNRLSFLLHASFSPTWNLGGADEEMV